MRTFAVALLLLGSSSAIFAQSARTTKDSSETTAQEKGFLSYIDFGGSSNAGGRVFMLGLSAGYEFNPHVSVGVRMPVYFVSADNTTANGTTTGSVSGERLRNNGFGDPSLALQLNFPNRTLNYQIMLTTWIPVASTTSGFSTGNVLVDWGNRISRPFGRLVPFGQVDVGNTVPDTPTFILPYTAQGTNVRLEGGANYQLTKISFAGASFYDVVPSGEQHVYSRMGMGGESSSNSSGDSGMMGSAPTGNQNSFMTNPVTVSNDLTRDHGFSTWFDASLSRYIDMEIGYTRSYGYDLNTVSFGVGFNVGAALRHGKK